MPGPLYLSPQAADRPSLRKAFLAFYQAFAADGKKAEPGSAPSVWDSSSIVLSALRQLGPNATANDIRQYILNLRDFAGTDGLYDFSSGDQHGLSDKSVVLTAFNPKTQEFVAVSAGGGVPLKNVNTVMR